jgi:hypothetical protein
LTERTKHPQKQLWLYWRLRAWFRGLIFDFEEAQSSKRNGISCDVKSNSRVEEKEACRLESGRFIEAWEVQDKNRLQPLERWYVHGKIN